ncbi:MAG: hypothetical protein Q8O30_10840 [Candidatus Omnitrophota bacterium]|nr:hypothetical protein [Candidatus Omnitrophota bacterium]
MQKGFVGSLVLVLALGLIFGFCVKFCFAQNETITITTYYPAPYGVYYELQTNKFAVGDTDDSGGLDAGDLPPANGQLYTARSVIYKPQSSLPSFDAREGELVYNDADNKFYYYDGSAWVAQGGGGGCYVNFGGTDCASGYTCVLAGRTTLYVHGVAGDHVAGGPVCSSLIHTGMALSSTFYAVQGGGLVDFLWGTNSAQYAANNGS